MCIVHPWFLIDNLQTARYNVNAIGYVIIPDFKFGQDMNINVLDLFLDR